MSDNQLIWPSRVRIAEPGLLEREAAEWRDNISKEFASMYRVESIMGSYPECVVKTPGGEIGPFDNRNAAQRELEILRIYFMAARMRQPHPF